MTDNFSSEHKVRKPRKQKIRSLYDIDTEIANLKREKENIVKAKADDIARIALQSGLAALDIPEKELKERFKQIADSFRES